MKLRLQEISRPLRTPWVTASGSLTTRELLLVELEGADGVVGYGEAAPLQSYDGVSISAARDAVEDCLDVLADSDGGDIASILQECWSRAVLPQAVAGIDLALWDLAGRRSDQPVWRLLGADQPAPVVVNATIAAGDRAGAAQEAAQARAAGFRCVKVKVGIGDDAGRLAAVRATAGAEMLLRIDANGAWTVPEAGAALQALEATGIELCEEPVAGLDSHQRLAAATSIPLALDESSVAPGALDRKACAAVCLKIARWGGIAGLMRAAERARAVGYEVYLASTLDGPLGLAAALNVAAVLAPERPCGLATLGVFANQPPQTAAQAARLPPGSGLGEHPPSWYQAS